MHRTLPGFESLPNRFGKLSFDQRAEPLFVTLPVGKGYPLGVPRSLEGPLKEQGRKSGRVHRENGEPGSDTVLESRQDGSQRTVPFPLLGVGKESPTVGGLGLVQPHHKTLPSRPIAPSATLKVKKRLTARSPEEGVFGAAHPRALSARQNGQADLARLFLQNDSSWLEKPPERVPRCVRDMGATDSMSSL